MYPHTKTWSDSLDNTKSLQKSAKQMIVYAQPTSLSFFNIVSANSSVQLFLGVRYQSFVQYEIFSAHDKQISLELGWYIHLSLSCLQHSQLVTSRRGTKGIHFDASMKARAVLRAIIETAWLQMTPRWAYLMFWFHGTHCSEACDSLILRAPSIRK